MFGLDGFGHSISSGIGHSLLTSSSLEFPELLVLAVVVVALVVVLGAALIAHLGVALVPFQMTVCQQLRLPMVFLFEVEVSSYRRAQHELADGSQEHSGP